jgi:HAE1 family hydrophobic/amphiphilic exporter-1
MVSVPMALIGGLLGLIYTHTTMNIVSMIGIVMLVGLVSKNAILLVDYTDILRQRGYDRTSALKEAGPTRLRPIIMTTMSVMVALLPIASGLEEGSELLQAAAVVLIGGLLTSTLLTLVFVPAMYTIFDDMQSGVLGRFRRLGGSRKPASVADTADAPTVVSPAPASGSWAIPTDARADGGDGHDGRSRPAPDGRPAGDPVPPEPAGTRGRH